MNKKSSRTSNWKEWSAFGDPRYREAARNNNKPSPRKKQNHRAGVLGLAGLIAATKGDKQ